jgi:alkylation response protein AidB-like acyl-CoA dehydrogenase
MEAHHVNFELSDEQQAFADLARRFAADKIEPNIREIELSGKFPRELASQMGEAGFFGCPFPEQYGGNETGFLAMTVVIEELARVWQPICALFNTQGCNVPYAILNWGNEDQRQRFIPDLISARKIGAIGLTEPGGGSDVVGAMRTRATKVDGGWILNGEKMWNTLASVADVDLIFAKTDPDAGARGITCFILELPSEGVEIREIPSAFLGSNMPSSNVHLTDVFVPDESVLAEPGQGLRVALNTLDFGRLTVPARCVGIAQGCVDQVTRYVREREAFGQEIGKFQSIQWQIADMVVETEAARWMTYRSASLKDRGQAATAVSARNKYYAAEVALSVAQKAFEIFGGYAVADEYRVAKMLTWANLYRTGEGSAHILRQLIAQDTLGYKSASRHNIPPKFPLTIQG